MSQIKRLNITAPPNSLFQGISTNYQDNLTYAEFLLGVLKKLNEMIVTVNEHSEFIDNYAGEIEKLQAEMAVFRAEWAKFKIDINKSVAEQIEAFKAEVYGELAAQLTQLRAYVDVQDNALRDYIDSVALGQIMLYNPVTGEYQNLQTVINSLYDNTRDDALTATEYDGLELTATEYDAYDLTASQYDTNGKSYLMNASV